MFTRTFSSRVACVKQDDRTPAEKKTHRWAIVAKDRCMSGWGGASGGASRCAWACAPDVNTDRVFNWVKSRSEMSYVSLVDLDTYRAPRGTAHFHIYVCNSDHVAARY
jgi:hypothetical protein